MAGTSWNHAVRHATDGEIELNARQGWTCRSCKAPVAYVISYNVTTGRSGRVGTRTTPVCTAHADKFAVKHNLALPNGGEF